MKMLAFYFIVIAVAVSVSGLHLQLIYFKDCGLLFDHKYEEVICLQIYKDDAKGKETKERKTERREKEDIIRFCLSIHWSLTIVNKGGLLHRVLLFRFCGRRIGYSNILN